MRESSAHLTLLLRPAVQVCALALAFAFCAALAPGAVPAAQATNAYGKLCAEFESSTNPYAYDASDPYGGNVFGAFQMSAAHAIAYARELKDSSNAVYAAYGATLVDAYKEDGNICTKHFAKAWASVFPGDSEAYLQTQYAYVKKNYYTPAAKAWHQAVPAFSVKSYTAALRNVVFSTAVQHGVQGSATIFTLAMDSIGGYKTSLSEDRIIVAIYAERAKAETYSVLKKRVKAKNSSAAVYKITKNDGGTLATTYGIKGLALTHFYSNSGAVQVGVYGRLAVREPARALKLYKKHAGVASPYSATTVQTMSKASAVNSTCKHAKTTGGSVTGYVNLTDRDHAEQISEVVCTKCGTVVAAGKTQTVKNKFVQKGAAWKDVSGRKYTVHSKGWYSARYTLNVRAKAKASSALRTTLPIDEAVKVRKAVMGTDGFWWGKVKVNGSTGFVQMQYLDRLGTASGTHAFAYGGACIYCGTTYARVTRAKEIAAAAKKGAVSCTFAKAGKAYRNAYEKNGTVVRSYAKGAQVKIVKVLKNRLNDYWGRTAKGTYVKLALLK